MQGGNDLYAQSQKMDNRIVDMQNKIKGLDEEIKGLYLKAKNSRGSEQKFVKQRLLQMLKKKKMYEQQVGHYYSSQNAIQNIQFTNENIQNTTEMVDAIKESNQAQKNAMKNVDMDEMADIMADQREMQMEVQMMHEEMNANMDNDYDEDDLDMELAEIENDMQLQGMMGQDPNFNMNQNQQSNQIQDPFLKM